VLVDSAAREPSYDLENERLVQYTDDLLLLACELDDNWEHLLVDLGKRSDLLVLVLLASLW
jgi:hypothetical protein